MLCALDLSVLGTHIVYSLECPCRGLHILVMGLSAMAKVALHWCAVKPHHMGVSTWKKKRRSTSCLVLMLVLV